jgi:hypothetical protein
MFKIHATHPQSPDTSSWQCLANVSINSHLGHILPIALPTLPGVHIEKKNKILFITREEQLLATTISQKP